jgi:hypothetical protein
MENKVIEKESWIMFADAVGDHQMIHRDLSKIDPEIVKKYEMIKEFAPGMYIASLVQGWPAIQSVKSIKFSPHRVYDGDVLKIVASPNKIGTAIDYHFNRGEDRVCDVNGVRMGDPDEKVPDDLKEVEHEYITEVHPANVGYYLSSLGYAIKDGRPNMFLASTAAPALLHYGEKNGVGGGFHASQGFTSHLPYEHGPLKILIGDCKLRESDEGDIQRGDLRWIQNDKVIASGRFSVGLLEKAVSK